MTRPDDDYLSINRASWNARVDVHLQSQFYDQASFLQGASSLKDIELAMLGDLTGKSVLHLQCHFGQDTVSLARAGARVVGVDFSERAIEVARELADTTATDARFVCCDVYDLPRHLDETFDVVFTSYGVLGWLPDMTRWSAVVDHFLKPGGRLVLVEFHPVVWMFDDAFTEVKYSYFNAGPIVEQEVGSYTDGGADLHTESVGWNHDLGEVLGALLGRGLRLTRFQEHAHSPYDCFGPTLEVAPGRFRIAHLGDKIPMVYALEALKPT